MLERRRKRRRLGAGDPTKAEAGVFMVLLFVGYISPLLVSH